jgi:hypothetical protein
MAACGGAVVNRTKPRRLLRRRSALAAAPWRGSPHRRREAHASAASTVVLVAGTRIGVGWAATSIGRRAARETAVWQSFEIRLVRVGRGHDFEFARGAQPGGSYRTAWAAGGQS